MTKNVKHILVIVLTVCYPMLWQVWWTFLGVDLLWTDNVIF